MSSTSEDIVSLPVSIPPISSFPTSAIHHIFLQKKPQQTTQEDARSLKLVNVPVDSTESHFRALFTSLVGAGRFESIIFEDEATQILSIAPAQASRLAAQLKKRKRDQDEESHAKEEEAAQLPRIWTRKLHQSGGSAIVLLADKRSVSSVLRAAGKLQKSKKYPIWGDGIGDKAPSLGTQWLKAHNKLSYPDINVVQDAVDAYFAVYNRKEAEAAQIARMIRNEPDEDGFVTVTRGGGRVAPARIQEAEEAKKRMLDRQEKKKDDTQYFYKYQLREKRKAEQAAFVNKFEEDKMKLKSLREKRRRIQPEE